MFLPAGGLNRENEITIGKAKLRNFRAMLSNYANDRTHGRSWPYADIQTMNGLYSYYRMVQKQDIDKLVINIGRKYGIDILKQIKKDLTV